MNDDRTWRDRIRNGQLVLDGKYAEPAFLVDGIVLDAGMTTLSASKGIGKTFLMLDLAAGIAAGGLALERIACERTRVLFLELELSERIVHQRLSRMQAERLQHLDLAFAWQRMPDGLDCLREAIVENGYGVVFVDVLQNLWPQGRKLNDYDDTYATLSPLRQLANELEVQIFCATHQRKASDDDVMNTTIGSVAVQANSDVQLFLDRVRESNDAVLSIYGNDLEHRDLALRFDPNRTAFVLQDANVAEFRQSPERCELIDQLRENGPTKVGELARRLGKSKQAISNLCGKLVAVNLIRSASYGMYEAITPSTPEPPSVSSVSSVRPEGEQTEVTPLTLLTPPPSGLKRSISVPSSGALHDL